MVTLLTESHVANGLAGANHPRAGLLIDLGLWNQPTCDPETAAGGEYFMPIGPWAKGKEKTYGEGIID